MLQFSPARLALSAHGLNQGNPVSVLWLRLAPLLCLALGLLGVSSTALAQIEPGAPGSVEYGVLSTNYTWVRTSDPIGVGSYVEDLLTDRWNQPDGRGAIGIVTETGWDADYGQMAAVVDFGRDYSVGLVFSELSAIQLVAVPEPSSLGLLLCGLLLSRAVPRRAGPAKADA